jgi:hypothetical protein
VLKNPDYSLWQDGYFEQAATAVAGPWLGAWVVAAAAVSNVGLFEAEMRSVAKPLLSVKSFDSYCKTLRQLLQELRYTALTLQCCVRTLCPCL